MWELTRWWHDSSLSAVTYFMGCCIGATFIELQTPTKWHFLLLLVGWLRHRKAAGNLKGREGQCDHPPPQNQQGCSRAGPDPKSVLRPHCSWHKPGFAGPVPQALSQIVSLIALTQAFMGRGCWLISLFPSLGCGQLFSWPLPKHLSERAGMRMLCSRSTVSLKSSNPCQKQMLHVRGLMEGRTKPFCKLVIFVVVV